MEPKETNVVDHTVGQPSPEGTQGSPVPSETTKPVESSEEAVAGKLPEGVSERTQKEFDKLLASNKALKEAADAPKEESVYDIFRSKPEDMPVVPAPSVVAPQEQSFTDEFGNVDAAKFNAAIAKANAMAEQADKTARDTEAKFVRADQDRQEKEAFAKHPYLDKKSPDFDARFYKLTRNQVLSNYALSKPANLIEIADDIASFYKPTNIEKVKDEAVNEYKKTVSTKAAAGASAGSRKPISGETHQNVVEASNAGVEGELAKRLKASGI